MGSLETGVFMKRTPLLRSSLSSGRGDRHYSFFHRPRSRFARFLLFEKVDYLQWICTVAIFFFVVVLFQAFLPGSVMEKSGGSVRELGLVSRDLVFFKGMDGLDFGEGIRFEPSKLLEKFRRDANSSMRSSGRLGVRAAVRKPQLALVVADLSIDAAQLLMTSIAVPLQEIGYSIQVYSFEDGPAHAVWRNIGLSASILAISNKSEIAIDWLNYDGVLVDSLKARDVMLCLFRHLLEKYRELEEAYEALNDNYNHLSETGEASELSTRFQKKCEENKKLAMQNEKFEACINKQKSVAESHRQLEELLKQKENENEMLRETTSKLSYEINELNASLSKQSESNAATSDYPRIVAELTQKFHSLYETMQEQAKQAELQADENNNLKLENESLNEKLENLRKLHLDLTEKFEKCDKVIKDLNKKVEGCDSRKDEFTHVFNEHRTLKLKYEKLRAKYSSLEDESNIIDGKKIASDYGKVVSVNKELSSRVMTLADELESIRRLSDGLRRRNENLENENRLMKEELLVAHAALQAAKRQSTENCHTSVELVKQIKSLQRSLQVFTSVKGSDFTINKEASLKLLREYDDCSKLNGQFPKLLLSCVLQRKILELIFDYTNNFFKETISAFDKVSNCNRSRIALTHQLVSLTNNVSVIQAADCDPSKIRDVNYNSLRSHIFENVKPLVDKILSVMNDCRSIKSSRKSRLYEEVINLVFNAISLYAFPTNNQGPVLEFVFFDSGTLFDEEKMEGACGDDISSDRAEIAVCYFPLIKSPGSDMMFSKAEVRMRELVIRTN